MVIEILEENKIMIVITKEDRLYNEIMLEDINLEDEKFDLFLKKVLLIIRIKTGLKIENCNLSIELIPLKEFYIMIITASSNISSSNINDRKVFKIKEPLVKEPKVYNIYKITNSEDLISAMKFICNNELDYKDCDVLVYYWNNSYYILTLNKKISNFKLNEYGYYIGNDISKSNFILEHGKFLCNKNMINKIAQIF